MEKVKTWTVIRAIVDRQPEDWAPWANVFDEHGIHGTLEEVNPPALVGYAHRDAELNALIAGLKEVGADRVELDEIVEENWAESWKQFFKPMRIGERFWIKPSWEELPDHEGRIIIEIDPGQAFGTGDHPTTRQCLEFIAEINPVGKSVADVGCGSGILSIAALKVGAANAVAIDIDPASVESTHENLERNRLTAEVHLGDGFAPLMGRTFDLVMSNIISATLIRVSHDASQVVAPGGTWLVSGVIEQNWKDVITEATKVGFTLIESRQEGEWIAATFRR